MDALQALNNSVIFCQSLKRVDAPLTMCLTWFTHDDVCAMLLSNCIEMAFLENLTNRLSGTFGFVSKSKGLAGHLPALQDIQQFDSAGQLVQICADLSARRAWQE